LLTFAPAGWSARNAHEANALLDELLGAGDLDANDALQTLGELQLSEMQAGLNLLRSFDPPGVGAHDLADCLELQLKRLPRRQWPSVDGWEAACAIAKDHLPLLAARDWTRLKKALNLKDHEEDEQILRDAQALIRTLQPLPGQDFDGEEAAYVLPDVIVRRTKAGWTAALNPDVMPRLRVNDLYSRILRRNKGANNLSVQLQEARWLVKNIHQRFDTILRVAQAIVERQREFFTHGEVAMRPLVLREIAEVLGLHESTISRVTTQKYMLTPTGTFELKYFFGSHVATDTGGAASSTAIRALLKQLVAAEDVQQPLSDSRLAEMLGEQGIVVARRTVAKYRESLRIPAVNQRKAL
jgi:RNA polymerase sigma-54 factor